jgi:hypothetical protein
VGQTRQWKTEENVFAGCRGSEHVMKRINPSCSEVYTSCSIDWQHTYAGCTTGRAHTYACCTTDRSRTCDRLISVEDCCLISVGAEDVS